MFYLYRRHNMYVLEEMSSPKKNTCPSESKGQYSSLFSRALPSSLFNALEKESYFNILIQLCTSLDRNAMSLQNCLLQKLLHDKHSEHTNESWRDMTLRSAEKSFALYTQKLSTFRTPTISLNLPCTVSNDDYIVCIALLSSDRL